MTNTHTIILTTHTTVHTVQRACPYSEGETTCHDMNDPPAYQPPLTNCHTYQTIVLVLPVTEVPARRVLSSLLIALRPYIVYIAVQLGKEGLANPSMHVLG